MDNDDRQIGRVIDTEAVEPSRYRLMFVPGGIAVRAVALMLALLMAFFAVVHTLNALDLVMR